MRLLLCISLLVLSDFAWSQSSVSLDRDPVFTKLLPRQINYPVVGERLGIYARVYVGFRVNEKGHVQDVTGLNPTQVGHGFDEEVLRAVKRLPPLHPRYQGAYVLPVTFAMIDPDNKRLLREPSGKLPDVYIGARTRLTGIRVIGGPPVRRGIYKAQTQGEVLTLEP